MSETDNQPGGFVTGTSRPPFFGAEILAEDRMIEEKSTDSETEESRTVLVRQYGLLTPIDWGADCQEHLWLQNKLWNTLVQIDQTARGRYFALMSAEPDVDEIERRLLALKEEKERLLSEKKTLRKEARKKAGVDTSVQDIRIAEISPNIRELAREAKEKRAEARARLKPEIDRIEDSRRSDVKAARNASGLWWGNYNAVCASYETARVRAMKSGAELKFHSFDGTGRFTCQIQGGMTVSEFFSGEKQALVSADPVSPAAFWHPSRGERRRAARTILRITVYTGKDAAGKPYRRMLSFPMVVHREIPENATIKQLVVSRKRVGTEFRWSITLTCTLAGSGQPGGRPEESEACGIDLGWRLVPEGLRVATIASSTGVRHIVLPEKALKRMDHTEDLKSRIDQELNRVMAWFRSQWPALAPSFPEDLRELFLRHVRAPKVSGRKLAGSILSWRDRHPDFRPDLLSALETWRKNNKRLTQEMDHLRDKIQAWRTDFYRNEAKRIAGSYSVVGIENFDLREVVKLETPEGEKTDQPALARANRVRASVSDLRKWIRLQAVKTGATVREIPSKDTTRACWKCAHVNRSSDPGALVWMCEACGERWDQDENAARNIREAARANGKHP